ncbi:MAG TPA: aminotransferase class V-fold PLP-dependent enzyme [Steroidobacter sp.]|nr:aminotransferase class V-fold PLP-dependent enzyme [Steroidobacter sp.]
MAESNPTCSRRDVLAGAGVLLAIGAAAPAQGRRTLDLPTSSRELWQWVRTQPVLDAQTVWLDAAASGPTLRAAMASEYRARDAQSFAIAGFDAERWLSETKQLAAHAAAFSGCDADEVRFTHGAGEALAQVVLGLDLADGDEIVTTDREHPAALSPLMMLARRRGVVVKQIALAAPLGGADEALEAFAGAMTNRTRAIMFSHVNYADGAVSPVRELSELARARGAVSIVDGAQALGMLDFQLRDLNCDFYAACFHKWLGGSRGSGMLYVRRDMLDRLWPTAPRGVEASQPVLTPTQWPAQAEAPAAIRKLGNIVPHAWPALRGMQAAMELHGQIGRSRIEARIRELAIYARLRLQQLPGVEFLTPARPGLWGGILTFRFPKVAASDAATSLARGERVYLRELVWPDADAGAGPGGALRTSLHVFNTHDDIERLARGLERVLRLAAAL